MNQQEINDFCRTCSILGVSPFDAIGAQKGDRFIAKGSGTPLIFQGVRQNSLNAGLFTSVYLPTSHNPYTYLFICVTPEKPYESNSIGSNQEP